MFQLKWQMFFSYYKSRLNLGYPAFKNRILYVLLLKTVVLTFGYARLVLKRPDSVKYIEISYPLVFTFCLQLKRWNLIALYPWIFYKGKRDLKKHLQLSE